MKREGQPTPTSMPGIITADRFVVTVYSQDQTYRVTDLAALAKSQGKKINLNGCSWAKISGDNLTIPKNSKICYIRFDPFDAAAATNTTTPSHKETVATTNPKTEWGWEPVIVGVAVVAIAGTIVARQILKTMASWADSAGLSYTPEPQITSPHSVASAQDGLQIGQQAAIRMNGVSWHDPEGNADALKVASMANAQLAEAGVPKEERAPYITEALKTAGEMRGAGSQVVVTAVVKENGRPLGIAVSGEKGIPGVAEAARGQVHTILSRSENPPSTPTQLSAPKDGERK